MTTAHTSGSIRVTPEGLQKVINRMAELEKDRDPYTKGWTQEDLVKKSGSSLSTVKRFLKGESISKPHVIWITGALNLDPLEVISPKEWNQDTSNLGIDWWEVCHTMLDNQQEQQRIRRKASEMGFEVNVHVPLGLVERKQQQRRDENVERGQVYQLEKEVITKTYEHNDFLEEVISQRSARKNKHVAIVGEPGAGKTTLLSAIASHIKDKTQHLPIFISLGSLQGMTLEDYLLKKWLPDAMRLVNPQFIPSAEIENQLITRFYQSGVWLLLDGVDEMGESSPVEALNKISRELTNWLGQPRVILTCRLNVWDASLNNNILPSFDTYKTQEFQPEQVNEFIDKWFKCAESIQRGEELKAKLTETGKERIPELVTNPLRLSLLCQIFYQNEEGELPGTKAEFYEIFTRYFYEWKPELVPDVINSYQLKKKLHQALGKLALAGINSDLKFRLKRSLAVEEMGEKLFKLAYDLGWLNQVDRDAVNDEDVYAFFHPNFQEYFAALIIDDWHYFLNHVPNNPEAGIYRIFEPQWKEVMLLWIGRKNVEKEQKESFLSTLIDLSDNNCNYFYYEQPDFLGALLIVEFPDFSRSYEIVENIVDYSFGYFDTNNQRWEKSPYFIVKRAKEILKLTSSYYVADAIFNKIRILIDAKKYMDENIFSELFFDIFWSLNKFDPNNGFVVNMLIGWIKEGEYWSNDDYDNPKTLPYDEIMTSNPDLINKLSGMLVKSYNSIVDKRKKEQIKNQINKNKLNQHNTHHHNKNYDGRLTPDDIDAMLETLDAENAEEDRLNELVGLDKNTLKLSGRFNIFTRTLTRITHSNQNTLNLFINILKQEWDDVNFDHDFCLELVTSLDKIEANKQELIDFLNEKLLDNYFIDDYRRCCVAEYLLKVESENHIAINILNESLPKIKDDNISLRIASALVETNTNNHEIINTLVRLLYDKKINEPQQNIRLDVKSISNFLRKVTPEKVINCLAKMAYQSNDARIVLDDVFQNTQYVFLRENVAWRILELEPTNQEALIFLLDTYKSQDDSASQFFAEETFIDILREYPESIKNFTNVLRNCQNFNTSKLIIWLLGEVSNENYQLEIVKVLKEILNTTNNEEIICAAATSLGKIDTGNIDAINTLLKFINTNESDGIAYLAVKELGAIANENLNAINTLINIISHTNDNEIKIVGIKSLSKIGVGNLDVVNTLINLMKNPNESDNYWLISKSLLQVMQGRLFAVAVAGLKDNFIGEDEDNDDYSYLLWHCAQNMSYPEFYRARHVESSPLQNLETQFTDIHSILSKLQPTDKTHPLVINLKSLQDETDTSAICQEICNQIYLTAFTENPEIPEVNNAPQLKRIIPQIKKQLQTQNIALILDNCEPNQIIITFCGKLIDVLHIAFITAQPLDAPLRGFPPNQPNLLNAIQTWINEIE